MDTTIPTYRRPVEPGNEPESLIRYWDEANDAYNDKDYRKALISIINYINPQVLADRNLEKDIDIICHHGSAGIHINITDDDFTVSAPFLNIHNANKIAIFRRAAEVNFFPLNLCQILLKDDALCFYFKTALDLCHPMKIYDVIREICISADNYDDEFIKKYQAEYYELPHTTQLTDEQKEKVWDSFRMIANQHKKYCEIFEENLLFGSMWDSIAISMLSIANMPYVHGTLRTDLNEALAIHYDGELDSDYRLNVGKSYLNRLFEETTRQQFMENIYMADTFISVKSRSSVEILENLFNEAKVNIVRDINDGNTFAAAYAMELFFLKLLYDYNLDGNHQDVIFNVLEMSGGKKSKVAAPILWKTYKAFADGAIKGGPRVKKGFFSRLFG